MSETNKKIGIFDSGLGGLSIWKSIHHLLPHEDYLYIADQAFFPYSSKTTRDIQKRTNALVSFLQNTQVKLIVIACNTATVSAIDFLRKQHPDIPLVGTVPVIKTCAEKTRNGLIGVMCTPKTARSAYQKRLIKTFAPNKHVYIQACPGLVEAIEYGTYTKKKAPLLQKPLNALLAKNIDTLALGCSHFPLITADIQAHSGTTIMVFDSAEAIARQVQRVLERNTAIKKTKTRGSTSFLTTGNPKNFDIMIKRYLNFTIKSRHIALTS